MRCRWMGRRLPPFMRGSTRARLRFQRQRAPSMGWSSTAWVRTSGAFVLLNMDCTLVSGKLCWGPSERTTVSSSAAACSSKSKETQKRLRSARPSARLMRPPNGSVDDQLRALAVVEAALHDHPLAGRQVTERRQAGRAIGHDLLGHLGGDAGAFLHERTRARRRPGPAGAAPTRRAGRSRPRRAPPCGPAPRRARRGWSAAGRRRRTRGPCRPRPWPPATSACPGGRCRPPSPRRRSPRGPSRPSPRRDRARRGSRPSLGWRHRR